MSFLIVESIQNCDIEVYHIFISSQDSGSQFEFVLSGAIHDMKDQWDIINPPRSRLWMEM